MNRNFSRSPVIAPQRPLTDIAPDERTDPGTDHVVAELVWYTIGRFARKQAHHGTRLRTQRIRLEAPGDRDARRSIVQRGGLHVGQL